MNLWQPHEDEKLRKFADEGLSAAQIGAELGKSRHAVIGRCHRLKIKLTGGKNGHALSVAAQRYRNIRGGKPKKIMKTRPVTLLPRSGNAEASIPLDASAPIPLMQMKDGLCRFPVSGERADTLFCGHATGSPLVSWCPLHCERVFSCQSMQVAA